MSRSFRYTFILVVVGLCAGLAAAGGWWFAKASAPVNGPIVLVSVDTLRADRVGAYGYAAARTPAIDALAADGLLFERAYSHVPQTLPAHAALLTGRLPFETGVRDAAGPVLPDSVRTVAEVLRDRGYATGGVVSSWLLRRDTGIARGFSFFDAELPPAADGSTGTALTRDGTDAEQVAEHWLDSAGTQRAFLFLHLSEPHAPHTPPERFSDLAPYDGEIAHADEAIGRLVRYLKAHQLYDRATIILVADHGEGLGDHGEQGHGLLAYDEVLRVPLVVKLPGGEGAGRRVEAPVQHIDLVPTILDLANAPGGGLSGRSLRPLFSGRSIAETTIYAESLFGEYRFQWAPIVSIVEGPYRYIRAGDRHELYDLTATTADRRNLATERADVVARLQQRLAGLLTREPVATDLTVTPADRERFEALGYIGVPVNAPTKPDGDPVDPRTRVEFVERYRSAVALTARRDWEGAIEAFRALAMEMPNSADLWMQVARTAARGERQDAAVEAYDRVLALEPGDASAHLGAAASLLRLRSLERAEEHARAVLQHDGISSVQTAEAHELLARIAVGRRNYDMARTEARAAEDADEGRPVQSFVEGRIALEQQRWADAATAFQSALAAAQTSQRPPLTDLRVFAAEALMRLERMDEAEALFDAELKSFPANVRARTGLQALYRATGRSSEAEARAQQH